jgi:uncharacterized RDD family membrane protein YckC
VSTAAAPVGYVGFVTRAVALVIDGIVVNVIVLLIGGAISLVSSLLGGDATLSAVEAVIGGFAWVLWVGIYFVTFWTLTGQTPGNRLLGIRVVTADGSRFKVRRAVRRFFGMIISAIPLGAGFLPVLVDDRRRGLHDRIGGTVVMWHEGKPDVVEPIVPQAYVEPIVLAPAPDPAPGVPQAPRVIGGSS